MICGESRARDAIGFLFGCKSVKIRTAKPYQWNAAHPCWEAECAHIVLNSTSLQPTPAKVRFGLPLILWTPSGHNQRREVPYGPGATEFHARV